MKNLSFILLFTFFSLYVYTSKAQENPIKVVVLGSSTAAGTGPTNSSNAWVNRYRRYVQSINSQNQVTNLAVGGYTTYRIMPTGYTPPTGRHTVNITHNITAALGYNPDAIVINLPSNDAAYGYSVEEQIRNYDTIMAKANEQKVPVWVCTTQPRNLDQAKKQNLMDVRDSTYSLFGDKAIDFWTDFANSDGSINSFYNSGDGTHLNDTAHGLLCQRVVDARILKFLSDDYLQAENYLTISEGETDSAYMGNSGDGFVRFQKKAGATVAWKLKATTAKLLALTFRYSNQEPDSNACQILVNGNVQKNIKFSPTGSESIWNQVEAELELSEGDNMVEVQALSEDGIPNLDYLSWNDAFVTYEKGSNTASIDVKDSKIEVYPNPANDRLYVRNVSGRIMLTTLQGAVIQKQFIASDNARLDISQLSKGLYILSCVKANGLVWSTKILKE